MDDQQIENQQPRGTAGRWVTVAAIVLLALGVGTRVYGAWAFRFILDADAGVVGLMARHMALGLDWPVFFYGQSYMGSLEPMISALFCKVLGIHGFSVGLGTALLASLALIPLLRWARHAGGPWAAPAALAVCVIGPRAYFFFQFVPRGGYMAALLLGTWVMYFGSRMAARAWARQRVGPGSFLLLGLAAGLGWWSNAIITPALAATALVLLIGLRGKFWLPAVWAGLAGFLLGSAPFWIWNLTHGWASLELLANVGTRPLGEGWALLPPRFMQLVASNDGSDRWRVAAAVLLLALAAWGLIAGLMSMRKAWNPAFVCAVLFILLSLALFLRSDYATMNTARYLIPVVPALALLIGVGVGQTRGSWRVIPLALLAATVGLQMPALGETAARNEATGDRQARADELAAFLRDTDTEAVYGHFSFYALNFMLEEQWAFTDMREERYLPIARRAELTERIAVLDNFGPIADFVTVSGGRATQAWPGRYRVEYGFEPPPEGLTALPTSRVASITDRGGRDLLPMLTDLNQDTVWNSTQAHPDGDCIEIRFRAPEPLRALRLLGPPGSFYHGRSRVDVLRPGAKDWETVYDDHPVPAFYWSGPRPYWNADRFRFVYRFDDTLVEAVRIVTVPAEGAIRPWPISECRLWRPGEDPVDRETAWDTLKQTLGDRDIDQLYAPRWVANRIHRTPELNMTTPLYSVAFPGGGLPDTVDLGLSWGVLVREPEAAASRTVLDRHRVAYTETALGRWTLFEADQPLVGGFCSDVSPITWSGFGLLTGNGQAMAGALIGEARQGMDNDTPPAEVVEKLETARGWYPGALTAAGDVLDWIAKRDPTALTPELADARATLASLAREDPIGFENGAELVAVRFDPDRVRPGDTVGISYFWQCPPEVNPTHLVVFVHLYQGAWVVQGDHILLDTVGPSRTESQLPGEVFREDRAITLPEDAPAGVYDLSIGLYWRRPSGQRLKPHTDRPVHRRAVLMPGILTVHSGD